MSRTLLGEAQNAPRYGGRAVLDTNLLCVPVAREHLARVLASHPGLSLVERPGDDSKHVVLIELSHVREGRMEALGIDQHALYETAGSLSGGFAAASVGAATGGGGGALLGATAGGLMGMVLGPVGSLLGAGVGTLAGGAWGSLAGGIAGVSIGAVLGRGGGGAVSRALTTLGGNYHELLFAIPDVRLAGEQRGPFTFVAGMYTDSRYARLVDRGLGYGYGKRSASFRAIPFRSYAVSDGSGASVVSVEFRRDTTVFQPVEGLAGFGRVAAWVRQPLLGHVGGSRYAISHLERTFDRGASGAAPSFAKLTVGVGCSLLPERPAQQLGAFGDARPAAFQIRGVPVRLTYPEAVVANARGGARVRR